VKKTGKMRGLLKKIEATIFAPENEEKQQEIFKLCIFHLVTHPLNVVTAKEEMAKRIETLREILMLEELEIIFSKSQASFNRCSVLAPNEEK
jgi:hypothetical protein